MAASNATTGTLPSGATFGDNGFSTNTDGDMSTPVRGHRFLFLTGDSGFPTTSFKEISGGFKAGQEAKEYREGGYARSTVRKIPGGLMTFDDITLSKGVMFNDEGMWTWNDSFLEGMQQKCIPHATIKVFNMSGSAVAMEFDLLNVWPKEWTMDNSLSADSSDILIEKLTLSCEGIARTI